MHDAAKLAVRQALSRHSPWTLARQQHLPVTLTTPHRVTSAPASALALAPASGAGPAVPPSPPSATPSSTEATTSASTERRPSQSRTSFSGGVARFWARRTLTGNSSTLSVPAPTASAAAAVAADDAATTPSSSTGSGEAIPSDSSATLAFGSRAVALQRDSHAERLWACHRAVKANLRKYSQGPWEPGEGPRSRPAGLTGGAASHGFSR